MVWNVSGGGNLAPLTCRDGGGCESSGAATVSVVVVMLI